MFDKKCVLTRKIMHKLSSNLCHRRDPDGCRVKRTSRTRSTPLGEGLSAQRHGASTLSCSQPHTWGSWQEKTTRPKDTRADRHKAVRACTSGSPLPCLSAGNDRRAGVRSRHPSPRGRGRGAGGGGGGGGGRKLHDPALSLNTFLSQAQLRRGQHLTPRLPHIHLSQVQAQERRAAPAAMQAAAWRVARVQECTCRRTAST